MIDSTFHLSNDREQNRKQEAGITGKILEEAQEAGSSSGETGSGVTGSGNSSIISLLGE